MTSSSNHSWTPQQHGHCSELTTRLPHPPLSILSQGVWSLVPGTHERMAGLIRGLIRAWLSVWFCSSLFSASVPVRLSLGSLQMLVSSMWDPQSASLFDCLAARRSHRKSHLVCEYQGRLRFRARSASSSLTLQQLQKHKNQSHQQQRKDCCCLSSRKQRRHRQSPHWRLFQAHAGLSETRCPRLA